MGYSLTYPTLVTEVCRIVEDDGPEFLAQLPSIIAMAQDAVQRDLDLSIWRTFTTGNLTAGSALANREDDWLKVLSIYLPAQGRHLDRKSLDYVRSFSATQGVPRCWAEQAEDQIRIAPTPAAAYAVEIEVHKKLPSLAVGNPVNWISRNCADLLLLATLIGSESFLVGQERMAEFNTLYQSTLSSALLELRGVKREEASPTRTASPPKLKE